MTPAEFRAARTEMGLDATAAATVLGYGAKTRIYEIENGTSVPRQTARMMALLLRVWRHAPDLLPEDWPRMER